MSARWEPIQPAVVCFQDGIPYAPRFEDWYFSRAGGVEEARHVFLEGNQLAHRWQGFSTANATSFVIAETGFGIGLNFLSAWQLWKKTAPSFARLHFISCEKHPLLPADLATCLDLFPAFKAQAKALLSVYPLLTPGFHRLSFEKGRVQLTLMFGEATLLYRSLLHSGDQELEPLVRDYFVDAWFLDGFSPRKNEAMWNNSLFSTMAMLSHAGSTFATYSSAGVVKRGLAEAGFRVQKCRGYGKKRDMLVGEWERPLLTSFEIPRKTPWHSPLAMRHSSKRAMIIGAGLAGCFTAYFLVRRGWKVVLIDAASDVANGTPVPAAVIHPQFSAHASPLSQLHLSAYLFATHFYSTVLSSLPIGELSGILQLSFNEKMALAHHQLVPWLKSYPGLGRVVTAEEASFLAGISLEVGGLFIPNAGWLNAQRLCEWLIQDAAIECVFNYPVSAFKQIRGEWEMGSWHASVLVIATGFQSNAFAETAHLPIQGVRGQISMIEGNEESASLKIPLCGEGHVLPLINGLHMFGASYIPRCQDKFWSTAENEENIARLSALPTAIKWSTMVKQQWVGVRAVTPDYLPMVGPIAEPVLFTEAFRAFSMDPNRFIPTPGPYHSGLYSCVGFGSRGLCTIPFCADYLAALISQEPTGLPKEMIQALSPARFLRRTIMRLTSLAI